MRIGTEITRELKLAMELLEEGFKHSYKAGELLQEVRALHETQEEFKRWVEENCREVEWEQVVGALRLFNKKKVEVMASHEGKSE